MSLSHEATSFALPPKAVEGRPAVSPLGAAVTQPGNILQKLIDNAVGGQVVLPVGQYVLDDSLRLRSGVKITTTGPVVLIRREVVESALLDVIGYGHCEFHPADPSAFQVGMGVALSDSRGGGFGTTVARIVGEKDGWLFIDTPASRDFRPTDGARVRSIFPMIVGYGVEHVDLGGITIDGGDAEHSLLDGCRDAGVYLIGCRDVRLNRIEVRGYAGDAISFQQCVDIYVQDCHLHHNTGHGIHPGSGTVRYAMRRNHVHDNGACGIYYCLRTTHSLCEENRIDGNADEGISIGERDTDHLVEGNIIRNNGLAGIGFRKPVITGGDRAVVRSNVFDGNGQIAAAAQVDVAGGVSDLLIENNAFANGKTSAIRIGAGCQRVVVGKNYTVGQLLPASDIDSASPVESHVGRPLPVGPAELAADGARHLRIDTLSQWIDRCD